MKGKTITDSAEALAVASPEEGATPPPPSEKTVHNPRKPKTKKGKTKDTGGKSGAETKGNKTDRRPVLLDVAKKLAMVAESMFILEPIMAPSWASGGRKINRLGNRIQKLGLKMEVMASK